MPWLKRTEPIILEQLSDLPYVIAEDGVRLCFDNYYYENIHHDGEKYKIRFVAHKKDLKRQSTNCLKFVNFPITIPFKHITSLNTTIINGKLLKTALSPVGDPKDIAIVKSSYLSTLSEDDFVDFVDIIDRYDKCYILVGKEMIAEARLLSDVSNVLYHNGCWGRTCVAIADNLHPNDNRKYKWTSAIPECTIACYGFSNTDDIDAFQDALANLDLRAYSTIWEG